VRKTVASAFLFASLAFAAAPPAPVPAGWLKLIDQLGSEDYDARKATEKKLAGLNVRRRIKAVTTQRRGRPPRAVLAAAIEKQLTARCVFRPHGRILPAGLARQRADSLGGQNGTGDIGRVGRGDG
jgi:hypothetical protein